MATASLSAGCRQRRGDVNFASNWRAAQSTPGITAARIFEEAGTWKVQLWGACHPEDCDWGVSTFFRLPDAEFQQQDRGFATWRDSKFTTFRFDGSELVIELYRVGERDDPEYLDSYSGVVRLVRSS